MFRYISIVLLLFLFSGLNGQKQDSLLLPAKAVITQDSVKTPAGTLNQDSVMSGSKPVKQKETIPYKLKDPPKKPIYSQLRLVPLKQDLITPQWIIAERQAALEKKNWMTGPRDTVRGPRVLKQWTLSEDFTEEEPVEFDTLFSLFNRYRIADVYSPVNANLGNYGLPYYSLNFFDRINDPDKYLYSHLNSFMHTSDNALFMNTQIPFTELKWVNSGEKEIAEQTFRIKHSQNINRNLNFGLVYDIIFSLGQYSNQRSEDKTFTFYTSYIGSRYKLYLSAGLNGLFGQENGGITDKNELDIEKTDMRDIQVKLGSINDASSFLRNRNFLVVQKYTFLGARPGNDTIPPKYREPAPLTGTFSHIFTLDYSRRMYRDAAPASGFYDSIYINNQVTLDSLSAKSVKNTFRFDFTTDERKFVKLSWGFGLRNENFWFGQIIPNQTVAGADTAGWYLKNIENWFRGNNVLLGRLSNQLGGKFSWLVNGELYFDRYRKGDYVLKGEINRSFDLKKGQLDWLVTGGINKRTPSFWYTQWGSNHFAWTFDPEKESRLEMGTRVSYPARHADIRLNYAVINNYLDFDTLALPSQDTSRLTVISLSLKKDFKIWKFHLEPDVIIQKSSNRDILNLPLATVRFAAYIEHMFRFDKTNGRLNTQLGIDVTYHTLYYPYAYMPATGRYYRQEESEAGEYPFINAFLNIKLKRTRFFLMFDHLNYGMMSGEKLYNYDMVPFYPQTIRRFTFGLAWTFYN